MLVTPHTKWLGDDVHGKYPAITPVWVHLDLVCSRIPGAPHDVVPDGLDMRGKVPGRVTGWFRSELGDWMAVVSYDIPYAYDRERKVRLVDQLVPQSALRPRVDPDAEQAPQSSG